MKAIIIAFLTSALCLNAHSQQKQMLNFGLMAQGQPFQLGKNYFIESLHDSINISKLKFYISDIVFTKQDKRRSSRAQTYFLIDAENSESLNVKTEVLTDFDNISFNIGVDSLTNVSGAKGGDLDPIHGMYWTWQSGYIGIKIEGYSPGCGTRNHFFQHHLGGYMFPNNCIQRVYFKIDEKEAQITIYVDVLKYFENIHIHNTPEVMSPGALAVSLATGFSKIFFIKDE